MPSYSPVPTLPGGVLLTLLVQIGVILLLAMLLGKLVGRFGMPAIVGELSVGVLLGPSLLGHLAPGAYRWLFPSAPDQMHLLDAVAQVGVLLLVGLTGAHLDLGLFRRERSTAVRVSVLGLAVPFVLGTAVAYFLPRGVIRAGTTDQRTFALFLGLAMCVSAIPVIAKTLIDMDLLHRNVGQLTLVSAMVDDSFGWTVLALISAMAAGGSVRGAAARALVSVAAVLLIAAIPGRIAVRALADRIRHWDAAAVSGLATALIMLSAAGTQALRLEPAFGAFLCGVLISGWKPADPAALAPLRTVTVGMLAPLYFATAGLRMDLSVLTQPSVLAVALLILLVAVVGKFAGVWAGARLSRMRRWEAVALGAGLNARGVIEVIIAMAGLRLGVLNARMYTVIILVAVVTSVLAPPILRAACARIDVAPEELERLERHRPVQLSGTGS